MPLNAESLGLDIVGGLKHIYNDIIGFSGYSGRFSDEVLSELRRSPDVDYIEQDSMVYALGSARGLSSGALEKNAPWGLARISHREQLGFSNFNRYQYDSKAGEGVTAYIIDTGINIDHVDFEGRASWGATIPDGDEDRDGNGHGTHCAGTVAGKRYGVAKNANVVAVKVLRSNGSGTMSDVLRGVEWAASAHLKAVAKAKKSDKPFKGSTANMSLGGGKSPSLDRAVDAAVKAGIHFAVAAGNDNADACNYSPAASVNAITVGASTLGDDRAYFSNHGKCTDIFAPGLNILSTWIGSKYATNTISGTSMASPHICGLLTYALSLQPEAKSGFSTPLDPAKLKKKMISLGSTGMLADLPAHTPNILAYNGFESKGDPWAVDAAAPVESPSSSFDEMKHIVLNEVNSVREEVEEEFSQIAEAFEKALAEAKATIRA